MTERAVALVLMASAACAERSIEDASPEPAAPPPPLVLRASDDRPLLLTYRSPETGRLETCERIDQVPQAARGSVIVTDLAQSPEARQAARYIQVADLRAPRADGTYAVSVASRYGFVPGGEAPDAATETGGVVLYSASWCGVCKKTARLLRSWRVPFEEKDIEASRSARDELAAKARAAGLRPGGVPVIDVAGTLLQGLDEHRLRSALAAARLLEPGPGAADPKAGSNPPGPG